MLLDHKDLLILDAVMRSAAIGIPPSLRELMALCDFNAIYSVKRRLEKLRDEGLLTWDREKSRTLTPTCRFIPAEDL